MRNMRRPARRVNECGSRWSEDKHVKHPIDWAHDERLGHEYGEEADTDFRSMRNRRLHAERDKRSLDEAVVDYMELIGKDVEIDGDMVTVVDIKEPEFRNDKEYYTIEFDDDSVVDLSPEEMDALLLNGNVYAYATDDSGDDVFLTIVDAYDESLHESVNTVQSIRRRKLLESLKSNRNKLNSKIKNKLNESKWSRSRKCMVDEDYDGKSYREDKRVRRPIDWAHDEDYGQDKPLRDTDFKSEMSRRLHGERIHRAMDEHQADQMYVVDFAKSIEDVDDEMIETFLSDLVDADIISYYEPLSDTKFAVTIFGEDANADEFAARLTEFFDDDYIDFVINDPKSHDVSEDEEDILESKISKIRAARLNEAKDVEIEVKPKSPHARKSIEGKKISLYKIDDLIKLLKDYKEERKELIKDGKFADKKGDTKAKKDVDRKLKMLDDKMEILTDEIAFRKKNKMNESVSRKFSRRLFEEEEEIELDIKDEEPEDDKSDKDTDKESEEDIVKDMIAVQLTVKDNAKVKDELIAAGIPEESIEIIKDSGEDEDGEIINGEIKIDADYAIELRDYLKGKGIDLEEKIGGEIISDEDTDSKEDEPEDKTDKTEELDIFGEETEEDK